MDKTETQIPDVEHENYHPIEDYGVIGDLRTTAHVGPNASIDLLCWPRFDSPSVFCALIDHRKGGRFQIVPLLENARQKKLYIPDTNILLSRFLSYDGVAEVSDFMLLDDDGPEQVLVRRAKAVRGDIRFRLECQPRFDYARAGHKVRRCANGLIFESEGEDELALELQSSVPLEIVDGDGFAEFRLKTGETAIFALMDARDDSSRVRVDQAWSARCYKRTADYWRHWVRHSRYRGRWRNAVNRSALALKLLTSREFGSIIAAPCFGLPNEVGGERNWDYRFTWIRDASFTLYAFLRLGFTAEAAAFMDWLEERCAELENGSALKVMYRIDGSAEVGETHLSHLEGYMGSQPVRIGSTNHDQLQLDIYGELLDAIYLHDKFGHPITYDLWQHVVSLVEWVCDNWRQPDAGIWEVRSGPQEFLYSRVMCWVAVDRALRLSRKRSLPANEAKWRDTRDRIYRSVFDELWSDERRAFVQFRGSKSMDASALILPLVKFISPADRRWRSTLEAIRQDLVHDSLVYRYNVGEAFPDELEGSEGTFSICSFWYTECVSRTGDVLQARHLFEKMLSYGNELGLFSEQLGKRGEFLGNIPQAFTHLSLISAAFDIDRRLSEGGCD